MTICKRFYDDACMKKKKIVDKNGAVIPVTNSAGLRSGTFHMIDDSSKSCESWRESINGIIDDSID